MRRLGRYLLRARNRLSVLVSVVEISQAAALLPSQHPGIQYEEPMQDRLNGGRASPSTRTESQRRR